MKISSCRVCYCSRNGMKILNELNRKKIKLKKVKYSEKGLYLTVNHNDLTICKQIAQTFAVNLEVVELYGLAKTLKSGKTHAFLLLSFIVAIMVVGILSGFVLKVDIVCDNPQFIGVAEQILQAQGINKFTHKSKIDLANVESMLLENIDGIGFASVSLQGICLNVNLVTIDRPETPQEIVSVVSFYDAIVTRVLVMSGTALVKQGDRVLKGEQLIGDYFIIDNDKYDDVIKGEQVPVQGSGEVYGKVYYSVKLFIPQQVYKQERTGRVKVSRSLSLGKLSLKAQKCDFERFDCVTTTSWFNNILPIKVTTYRYYEYAEVEVDREIYKNDMIAQARAEVMENLPYGANLLKEWTIGTNLQGMEQLELHFEVEQRIDR